MEIKLSDMQRLVDIGQKIANQHQEFMQAEIVETVFKPRGEKVYMHVTCIVKKLHHNFRYKIDIDQEVEGEGWPVKQIGYDNYGPTKK
jgi:hypothetical protein